MRTPLSLSPKARRLFDYAYCNGAYKNRTNRQRAYNRSEVIEGENISLELENTAEYASFVEAKGYDVLSGAFLNS